MTMFIDLTAGYGLSMNQNVTVIWTL